MIDSNSSASVWGLYTPWRPLFLKPTLDMVHHVMNMVHQVTKDQDQDQSTGMMLNTLTIISTIMMNPDNINGQVTGQVIGQVISQAISHLIVNLLTHEDHLHLEQGRIDTPQIMVSSVTL